MAEVVKENGSYSHPYPTICCPDMYSISVESLKFCSKWMHTSSPLLSSLVLWFPLHCTYNISFTVVCKRSPWKCVSLDKSGLLGGINLVSGPQPLQGLWLQSAEVLLEVSHARSPGAKVSIEKCAHAHTICHIHYTTSHKVVNVYTR